MTRPTASPGRPAGAGHVRPIHPWSLAGASDPRHVVLALERSVYDTNRKNRHTASEVLDFSDTGIPEHIRLCLVAYVLLGKLQPSHAQSLIREYTACDRAAAHLTAPASLRDFLSRLDTGLLRVFDDPMQGVLTRPFHHGLFGDTSLVEALDFLNAAHPREYSDIVALYAALYTTCRQHVLDMAFSMARSTPSLTQAEIDSGEEFFAWWRQRWHKDIHITISESRNVTLFLPGIPDKSLVAITKVIQEICDDYAKLARLLGRPDEAVEDFVRTFVVELNEGMINLPLNQYGGPRCPAAQELDTRIRSSEGYPTTVPHVKEVSVAGVVLEDVFKRFFPVRERHFLLPRTRETITVSQLGSCPFPDYGFTSDSQR